jgi:aryl-alcohol dehydrogenase
MIDVPAIVLAERGRPPALEYVAIDAPRPAEVRVRMVASGVCHTDPKENTPWLSLL